jgi:nucleoside permease NupC
MNAPASLYIAKMMFPETEESSSNEGVRDVRDTESSNVIDPPRAARWPVGGSR